MPLSNLIAFLNGKGEHRDMGLGKEGRRWREKEGKQREEERE